jgi:hypothetical protein
MEKRVCKCIGSSLIPPASPLVKLSVECVDSYLANAPDAWHHLGYARDEQLVSNGVQISICC